MKSQYIIAALSAAYPLILKGIGAAAFSWIIKKLLKNRKAIVSAITKRRRFANVVGSLFGLIIPSVGILLFCFDATPISRGEIVAFSANVASMLLFLINRNSAHENRMHDYHSQAIYSVWTHIDGIKGWVGMPLDSMEASRGDYNQG